MWQPERHSSSFADARLAVICPGFDEPDKDLRTIIEGRNGNPGLTARGFECVCFPRQDDNLDDRIDRFLAFVEKLKEREPERFPIVAIGYSLGGLVVRGFLRRYAHLTSEISHTIQIGAPNWGLASVLLPQLTGVFRLADKSMRDMDIRSDFMRWLNGTSGHWTHRPGERWKFWKLDAEPLIAPPGAKLLSIAGCVPNFGDDNDGLVWTDSATLGDRMTAHVIRHEYANHLNLVGIGNPFTAVFKGFRKNDEVWPLVLDAIVRYVEPSRA